VVRVQPKNHHPVLVKGKPREKNPPLRVKGGRVKGRKTAPSGTTTRGGSNQVTVRKGEVHKKKFGKMKKGKPGDP